MRSHNGLELYSMVNVKNRVQIPEAEEGELEDDDDDDELKMMTHAFTKCQDKCAFAPSVWKVFTLRLAMRIVRRVEGRGMNGKLKRKDPIGR